VEKLHNIIRYLEEFAPPQYQESYDNCGLITGDPEMDIRGALICLDSTEAVIDEAVAHGCNLIIAHHPIVFSGLKKITGKNYIERVIIKAIRNNLAIYAIHTNLDNIREGVNSEICNRLGLLNTRILCPKRNQLKKLITYCPADHAENLKNALFAAGAGQIGNYDECSFSFSGTGTFRGNGISNPVIGERGIRHYENETCIDVIMEAWKEPAILKALFSNHPYEEVAYNTYTVDNQYSNVGSGMIGELEEPQKATEFLMHIKFALKAPLIRYTRFTKEFVSRIAVCGGSGSFLLGDAISAGADIFITADFKYHQFFDAEDKIVIADIGHFESEQFTNDLLMRKIQSKFTTFALRITETDTNPVNYL